MRILETFTAPLFSYQILIASTASFLHFHSHLRGWAQAHVPGLGKRGGLDGGERGERI
jgi:hypothetical protein